MSTVLAVETTLAVSGCVTCLPPVSSALHEHMEAIRKDTMRNRENGLGLFHIFQLLVLCWKRAGYVRFDAYETCVAAFCACEWPVFFASFPLVATSCPQNYANISLEAINYFCFLARLRMFSLFCRINKPQPLSQLDDRRSRSAEKPLPSFVDMTSIKV